MCRQLLLVLRGILPSSQFKRLHNLFELTLCTATVAIAAATLAIAAAAIAIAAAIATAAAAPAAAQLRQQDIQLGG